MEARLFFGFDSIGSVMHSDAFWSCGRKKGRLGNPDEQGNENAVNYSL